MTRRLFGTDGVRGIANLDLTPKLAFELGRAGAYILGESKTSPLIVIGKDTRVSGDMLESALAAGICSVGGIVLKVGVIPTPGIAYLTRYYNADGGAVISASHNPFEYNGIKFFDKEGFKLSDEQEEKIEQTMKREDLPKPTGASLGRIMEIFNTGTAYVEFLKSTIDKDLKGLHIAVDCANGAAYKIAPQVFADLGAEVHIINNQPTGYNINVECGSTHPEAVGKFVVENSLDIGLSFDGDADRLIAVDEKGRILNGDYIMAVCGIFMKNKSTLKKDTVVTTVMSNIGLETTFKEAGCRMIRTKVGDRYVLEEMLKNGYMLGGEQSGHIIFLEHNTTGDGLLTALQLLNIMKETGKPISELCSTLQIFPQFLLNAKVKNKAGLLENPLVISKIKAAEKKLNSKGRILVRPSGTEPLVRVMVEGKDETELKKIAGELVEILERELN